MTKPTQPLVKYNKQIWQTGTFAIPVVIVIAAASIGILFQYRDAAPPAKAGYGIPEWATIVGNIRRTEWSTYKGNVATWPTIADEISSYRDPVVLSNTPAELWQARTKWVQASYLIDSVGTIHQAKTGNYSLFVYEQDHKDNELVRLANIDGMKVALPPPTVRLDDKQLETFLQCKSVNGSQVPRSVKPCESTFSYYSRKANNRDEFGKVIDDVMPIGDFVVYNDWLDCRRNGGADVEKCNTVNTEVLKRADVHVWLGQPGVVTAAHFDTSHNFFVQLRGRKRFVIGKPESWIDFLLYSADHPRSRHSQFDGCELDQFLYDQLLDSHLKPFTVPPITAQGNANVFIADLGPGDVLYLPPYHLHRVTALPGDYSISVNVWTSSKEEVLKDKVGEAPIPQVILSHLNSSSTKKELLRYYLLKLVDGVASMKAKYDMQQLHVEHVDDKASPKFSYAKPSSKPRSSRNLVKFVLHQRFLSRSEFAQSMNCNQFNKNECPSKNLDQAGSEHDRFQISSSISKIVASFESYYLQIQDTTNKKVGNDASAITDMILVDFMERTISKVLGLAASCTFLQCLSM